MLQYLQWAQAIAALIGALIGAAGGIFAAGRLLGRIESRLELKFKSAVDESEKRLEEKVIESTQAFDETLKGLRQKINDVELDAERRFLPKEEFVDFRAEYREDIRDLKALIGGNSRRS